MAERKLTSNTPEPVEDNTIDETPLEANEENIDPRLDNRVGNQRPPLETFPAKPQQVDGPDVANSPTAREAVQMVEEQEDNVNRKGMASPGPHGLGATKAVPMEEAKNTTVASDRASRAAEEAKTSTTKKETK